MVTYGGPDIGECTNWKGYYLEEKERHQMLSQWLHDNYRKIHDEYEIHFRKWRDRDVCTFNTTSS